MFKKIVFSYFLLSVAFLQVCESHSFSKNDLRVGDLILLPLDCPSCLMIADETGGPYSHSGLVARDLDGNFIVLESLGRVRDLSIEEFILRLPEGIDASVYRSRELEKAFIGEELYLLYLEEYKGLGFDYSYLWDNFDKEGRQLLYCSEFITKLLNHFLTIKISTKPMTFERNWRFWNRAFNGNIPQGLPGNNPNSFTDKDLFNFLGKLSLK